MSQEEIINTLKEYVRKNAGLSHKKGAITGKLHLVTGETYRVINDFYNWYDFNSKEVQFIQTVKKSIHICLK